MHYKHYCKLVAFLGTALLLNACAHHAARPSAQLADACASYQASAGLERQAIDRSGRFSYSGQAQDPDSVATRLNPEDLAAQRRLSENDPFTYLVKRGDTLWDISAKFLQDPWLWPEIWFQNGQIFNPHLIFPGDVISLQWLDGQPVLRINAGNVRLSPRIRTEALSFAIPQIPIDAIRDFFTGPRFITAEELHNAAYIVSAEDERLLGLEEVNIYARKPNAKTHGSEGERYLIVHPGEIYTDPLTERVLGYEVITAGEAKLTTAGNPSTLRITQSIREALAGDRLLPLPAEEFPSDIFPRPPEQPIRGQVIAAFDEITRVGQYQIATINVGAESGLALGHLVRIERPGLSVIDPITHEPVLLPNQPSATGLVFRASEGLSHLLMLEATREVKRLDYVCNP